MAQAAATQMGAGAEQAQALGDKIRQLPTTKLIQVEVDLLLSDTYRRLAEGFAKDSAAGGPTILPLAGGGKAMAGRPYLVGEQGIELFVPNVTGTIVPNDQLATVQARDYTPVGAGAGARATTIEHLSVVNPVDATADEVVSAIGAKLGWLLTTRSER